jgi:hypothetical protein
LFVLLTLLLLSMFFGLSMLPFIFTPIVILTKVNKSSSSSSSF